MASLVSTSSTGFGMVEQIGKGEKIELNAGGHPWDLTGGRDAVLLLFNQSQTPKIFNVKIGHDGILWWQAWQLAPMETRAVSIRELIAGREKDLNGAVLPQGLDSGEVSWFTPNIGEGKGRLMEIDAGSQTVAGIAKVARISVASTTWCCAGRICRLTRSRLGTTK